MKKIAVITFLCLLYSSCGPILAQTAQAAINLGTGSVYAVLAGSTITNSGATTLCGNLGLFPGTVVSGSPQLVCGGVSHINNGAASTAQGDLTAAYNDALSRSGGVTFTPIYDIGGLLFYPDLYTEPSSLSITGPVTLDAQGDPNAVFIFKIGSTLMTGANSQIVLLNSARAANVFWQVGSSCALGANSVFKGTLLVNVSASVNNGATVEGRILARTGAVDFDTNISAMPAPPVPTPTETSTPSVTPNSTATNTPTNSPTVVAVPEANGLTPDGLFGANHNAFSPSAESVIFYYKVPADAHVQLLVYNVLGLRVRTLVDGDRTAATWSAAWDGRNDQGTIVASDVYFILIKIGESRYIRKIAVLRERQ